MLFIISFIVLPLLTECKPLETEITPAMIDSNDFEEIILTDDQFMGNISDLNPFDKQIVVEKTVLHFRRHFIVLVKALQKLNDPNLWENYKTLESELDSSEQHFMNNTDLDRFYLSMAVLSVNLMDLQNQVIDRLTTDEVIEEKVVNKFIPDLKLRYDTSDELIERRLHDLWKHLKDFTRFVEEVIEDVGDKRK